MYVRFGEKDRRKVYVWTWWEDNIKMDLREVGWYRM
jgi:hypothetical protein